MTIIVIEWLDGKRARRVKTPVEERLPAAGRRANGASNDGPTKQNSRSAKSSTGAQGPKRKTSSKAPTEKRLPAAGRPANYAGPSRRHSGRKPRNGSPLRNQMQGPSAWGKQSGSTLRCVAFRQGTQDENHATLAPTKPNSKPTNSCSAVATCANVARTVTHCFGRARID